MIWRTASRIMRSLLRQHAEPPAAVEASARPLTAHDERTWQRFARLSLVRRAPARAGLGGEHLSRSRSSSNEFVDYRAYQPGDDFRRVDWNVYGRLGTLQVKVTETPERLEVVLVIDCSTSMRWGTPDKLDRATQVAEALGYVALCRADVLRIVRLGAETRAFGPVRGSASFPAVLAFLGQAQFTEDCQVSLAAHLTDLVVPRSAPLVVVLSDFLEPDVAALGAALDRLAREGADIAMIHLLSPQEEDPRAYGAVELVDVETGARLDVTLSLDAIRRYRARLAAWLSDVEALATMRGFRYVRARTDRPTAALLLDDLRTAGLVR